MKKNSIATFVAVMGVIIVAAFPALFLYFQNAGEAHFGDIVPAMLAFIAAGLILFGLMLLVTRKPAKAGLIAFLFLMVFLNYALIERLIQKVFPMLRYWHIAPTLLVVLLHVAWIICRRLPDDIGEIIMPVLSGVVALLIVMNGATAIPKISTRLKAEQEAKKHVAQESGSKADMPNFYFILFDEYSTIPFMQKYFSYDNSDLLNRLSSLGFNLSQTGHNDATSTAVITANLFQMDYLAKQDQTPSEVLLQMRVDNPVFDHFKAAGYDIISPAGAASYGLDDAMGHVSKASTITGEDIQSILLLNTVAYPFVSRYRLGEAQLILDQIDYLKNNVCDSNSSRFVLAHINCPHEPFYFTSDGDIKPWISNSWKDLDMYLQQYIFITGKMIEIAEAITVQDSDAIVWILSDHGARAASDPDTFGIFSFEDMTNFFSAVYYQGQTLDIEGLSGVNTFRLILNKLFDENYDMISLPTN